jgi:2-alkenal reductase
MAAVAMISGVVGAALTVGVLGASGYLARPSTAAGSSPIQTAANLPPTVTTIEQSDIIAAVDRVSQAVVTITSRVTTGDLVATDPFSLPATGVGSGIIFSSDQGLVLTARHVVCGADALTVKLLDGREFPATTYGVDTLTDLAIVQIGQEDLDLPIARVGDSSALLPGQVAIAIGSPLGTYTNSVTSGVISATGRDVPVSERCGIGGQRILRGLIQTDAAINPGNSGGPLIDASGRVIGVSTAVAGDSEGIGFAVPVDIARPIMEQAIAGKPLTRPWIGVFYEPVTPALVSRLDLPVDYGVLVSQPVGGSDPAVVADSPAARAGVLEGDLITAINEQRIDASHSLDDRLSQYRPDDMLTLSVMRDGQTLAIRMTLGTRPAQQ